MHVAFGCFIAAASLLQLLLSYSYSGISIPFVVPLELAYVGIMFLFHHQDYQYDLFIHQAFGVTNVILAVLYSLVQWRPQQWSILFFLIGYIWSLLLFSAAESILTQLRYSMARATFVLMLTSIGVCWMLLLLTTIAVIRRLVARYGRRLPSSLLRCCSYLCRCCNINNSMAHSHARAHAHTRVHINHDNNGDDLQLDLDTIDIHDDSSDAHNSSIHHHSNGDAHTDDHLNGHPHPHGHDHAHATNNAIHARVIADSEDDIELLAS
jgi:hypothetical protein